MQFLVDLFIGGCLNVTHGQYAASFIELSVCIAIGAEITIHTNRENAETEPSARGIRARWRGLSKRRKVYLAVAAVCTAGAVAALVTGVGLPVVTVAFGVVALAQPLIFEAGKAPVPERN
jgi:hypothetical protein